MDVCVLTVVVEVVRALDVLVEVTVAVTGQWLEHLDWASSGSFNTGERGWCI